LRAETARESFRKFSSAMFHAKAPEGKRPQRVSFEKRDEASSRSVKVKRYFEAIE